MYTTARDGTRARNVGPRPTPRVKMCAERKAMSKTETETPAETEFKTLTIKIPKELYELFEQRAAKEGRTPEAVALAFWAATELKPRPELSEEERQKALDDLRQFAGAVNSGDPRSADNERIDEDLAREYGSSHEED